MKIKRTSPLTGQINEMDIPVTQDQLDRWEKGEDLIQNIMPHLTHDEREFIMTGYTAEDWDTMFPEEEESDTCYDDPYWPCDTQEERDIDL